jgi:hypothetical protein
MNTVYYTVTAYTILGVLAVALIGFDLLALEQNSSISGIFIVIKNGLAYLLGAMVFSAIAVNFKIIYKGTYTSTVFNTLNGIAIAFVAYFVCSINLLPLQIQTLSVFIFILIMLISAYYLLNNVLRIQQQITLLAITRFVVLACIGFILRFSVLAIGENSIVAEILLYGFLFGGVTALFYPLKYSKKSYAKKIGGWVGTRTIVKVTIGLFLATYALLMRPYIFQMNENWVLIGEWIFIGILATVSFLLLRAKLDDISAPIIMSGWIKHTQELDFKSSPELNKLSQDIDNFLQTGDKDALALFLFDFLSEQKLPHLQIYQTLKELFNFQDKPTPHLIFSWDYPLFQESEKIRRKEAIKNVIEKLSPELFRSNQGDK